MYQNDICVWGQLSSGSGVASGQAVDASLLVLWGLTLPMRPDLEIGLEVLVTPSRAILA